MAKILITPEYVRKIGGDFRAAANENLARINRLNKQMEDLRAQWEGASREKFYADFEKAKATMNAYSPLLDGIGTELSQIGQRFAEADQQASPAAAPSTQPSAPASRNVTTEQLGAYKAVGRAEGSGANIYQDSNGNNFISTQASWTVRPVFSRGFAPDIWVTGYKLTPYSGQIAGS